ncbi:MAG TPA: hypothetical protein VGI86_10810 [Acidimicrobiia bacterium]|jgi:hypothetical protein
MVHGERQCLGLLGLFDVDDLDVQVRVRVAVQELARRRPDVTVRLFAPFGSTRPVPIAADLAVEALAPLSVARERALLDELDALIVVGTTDVTATDAYPEHPAVDPRDVDACRAFMSAPPAAITHARDPDNPHPALLGRRVWPYGVCEQRREFLRAMHWWPQRGAPIVVAGSDSDVPDIEALASRFRLGDRAVAVVGIGVGGHEFAEAMAARLRRRGVHYMPANRSSIEDRVAAIAGAASVVASQPAVLAVAEAYGRPLRTIEAFANAPASRTAKRASATVRKVESALDDAYDELAALVPGEQTSTLVPGEITALRDALEAQARRVAHERVVLADYVRAVRNNAAQESATLRDALAERPLQRLRDALRHKP